MIETKKERPKDENVDKDHLEKTKQEGKADGDDMKWNKHEENVDKVDLEKTKDEESVLIY